MKYCSQCGKELVDEAVVCPNCGCAVQAPVNPQEDKPSTGLNILAFLFPLVGLILYLVWKAEYPLKAKSCGKGALIAVIVDIVLAVIYVIFFMIILSAGACAVTMAACL